MTARIDLPIALIIDFSTFSVRATTIARMAASTHASQMAAGGLLLLILLQTVTT